MKFDVIKSLSYFLSFLFYLFLLANDLFLVGNAFKLLTCDVT